MALVYLVRHGESEANALGILTDSLEGYPLTAKGVEEVKAMSLQLSKFRFDRIVSSPVLRARQSAAIISDALNKPIEIDARIRESSMGGYNNRKYFELPAGGRVEKGLESWASMTSRMVGFAESLEGSVIAVTHQITIRVLLAHYMGIGELESYGIDISRASVSVADTENGRIYAVGSRRLKRDFANEEKR
jgi:probable phosphoglycerate mutase